MTNYTTTGSISKKPSKTAMIAALYRYLSLFENDPYFPCADQHAYTFLPTYLQVLSATSGGRKFLKAVFRKILPGSYEFIVARTKFVDECFLSAIANNVQQVVFLGAGYDSRVVRFQEVLKNIQVFELDVPTTQADKLYRYKKSKLSIPQNVRFVPINFDTDSIIDKLLQEGFSTDKKTLFLWEGVTQYITEEAVVKTMRFFQQYGADGSLLFLDYFFDSVIRKDDTSVEASNLTKGSVVLDEQFKFGIKQGTIEEFLNRFDFHLMSHYEGAELASKYLANGRADYNVGFPFSGHAMACLRKNDDI